MLCPSCGERPAKRACPALAKHICAVCCGAKRLVEIACPATCAYLASARTHPPAVERRQQERDARLVAPIVEGLSDDQEDLFWLFLTYVDQHRVDGFLSARDPDVVDAAVSLAATLETADRGVIYEHRPASLSAQRLMSGLGGLVREAARQKPPRQVDRDAIVALRRLARAGEAARKELPSGETVFIELIGRVVRLVNSAPGAGPHAPEHVAQPGPSIILP
jgi:hypothetical protein